MSIWVPYRPRRNRYRRYSRSSATRSCSYRSLESSPIIKDYSLNHGKRGWGKTRGFSAKGRGARGNPSGFPQFVRRRRTKNFQSFSAGRVPAENTLTQPPWAASPVTDVTGEGGGRGESGEAPPAADEANRFRGSGAIGGPNRAGNRNAATVQACSPLTHSPVCSRMYFRAFMAYSSGLALAGSCSASTSSQPW